MGDWFVWLARLMYVGIFALGIGMCFRAWAIGMRKDHRYVADWRGRSIRDAGRWAYVVMMVNAVGGVGLLLLGALVLLLGLKFTVWTGLGALFLWSYYFALRVVVQRANSSSST